MNRLRPSTGGGVIVRGTDVHLIQQLPQLLQVPGGETAAARLVILAIALSLGALIVSEWFARRAGMRFQGQ